MGRNKTQKVIFTFSTITQAMKMEACCRKRQTCGRLIPVPRQISAGCGMAWAAETDAREVLKNLTVQEEIEVEGIYELLL